MNMRSGACAALAAVAGLAFAATVVTLAGRALQFTAAGLRIRAADPLRALVITAAASAILLGAGWSFRPWRRAALALLSICALLTLPLLARRAPLFFPIGDGAITQVYTLHAVHGAQLLGPYSQYGWFHPGPLMFYWFAPFYVFSGWIASGLGAAALALNLVTLSFIGWLLARRPIVDVPFAASLWALVALYLWRLPELGTSAWNPHVLVLPFAAMVLVAALVFASEVRALPLLVAFASFVMQAHVGVAPAAIALTAAASIRVAAIARRQPEQRPVIARWTLISIVVLEGLWLLPVAEEIANHPGNLTQLWRFFMTTSTPQAFSVAWSAWATTLARVFDASFRLPLGGGWFTSSPAWLPWSGTCVTLALLPAALSRRLPPYVRSVAACAFLASATGLWSVWKIRGEIANHQIFWLSGLGVINAAAVATWLLAIARHGSHGAPQGRWVPAVAAAAVISVVAAVGARDVANGHSNGQVSPENRAVAALTQGAIEALATTGGRKPVVRIDAAVWGVGSGVILQLAKASVPFGVDELASLFGRRLAADGSEDMLLIVSGRQRHREVLARPGARTVANYDDRWFVDIIPLPGPIRPLD